MRRVTTLLQGFNTEQATLRLVMRGVSPALLRPVEVEERDGREADVMRRTLEATRVQLRTQQAERMRCERELRLLRSKVDGLKAAGDAAVAARTVAEEQLDVQKVAAQAMMQSKRVWAMIWPMAAQAAIGSTPTRAMIPSMAVMAMTSPPQPMPITI
jgi:hypothetical protein